MNFTFKEMVLMLFFGLVLGCSEEGADGENSRVGQPCGNEGYGLYCETEQVLLECYKCNDFTSNKCWKKIGCGPEYKCRYLIVQLMDKNYEAALCLEPTDSAYPFSTSSPQTFEK